MKHHQRNGVRPSRSGGRRWVVRWRGAVYSALALAVLSLALMPGMVGCDTNKPRTRAPGVAPMPTYTGPAYLRGTIGSLTRLRPGTEQPMLVNGYGIVVNLNGTGSTTAPPALRQALINQMKKYGLGSANLKTLDMTPERVLADPNTAVVRIDGLVRPGALPGQRFDVLVSAIDSQTTSLDGGTLWTSTLAVGGAQQAFKYLREQATAYGPIYDNPYRDETNSDGSQEFGREQAIVVAGGTVTAARDLELVLNQSSYTRCRAIADRINERFGKTTDAKPLAHPVTDQLIEINVPPRYADDPGQLIELIMHLYLQTGPGFEEQQATRLAEILRTDPETERSVRLAWQSLGRPTVQVLRQYYNDPDMHVRLAALEAGAWLDDERASESLSELAENPDPALRIRAARALVSLPRSIKGSRALKSLLDDEETAVRIAAYESLSSINDGVISEGRVFVTDELGNDLKYIIDAVPSERPLVYITQVGVPRIVIFKPDLGFKTPLLTHMWDHRLMLTMDPGQNYLNLFYQPAFKTNPDAPSSIKLKTMPDLKTLVYVLGHKPTIEQPNEGLDLTYSQVVNVVYQLCQQGDVEAPIEVVVSPLAKQVTDFEKADTVPDRLETRPETSGPDDVSQTDPGASPGVAPVPTSRPDTTYPSTDTQTTSSR